MALRTGARKQLSLAVPTHSLEVTRWLRLATEAAADQEQVAARRALYAAGVPRWLITREVRLGRWQTQGSQCVVLHNGPLPLRARWWVAVLEMGPSAALDGVTGMQAAGVAALTDDDVHVSVPRGARRRRLAGVVVHETRKHRAEDVVRVGIPRMPPHVAAVHAALWSRTERQALFMVTLVVQQRLATTSQLLEVLRRVRRSRWRKPVLAMLAELDAGIGSLNELDVARAMRARSLPEPDRQVVRRRSNGKEYLDARFTKYRIVLEIDGEQHELPWQQLIDLLRDLATATSDETPLRISVAAWHAGREQILDALEGLFRARGWRPEAA
ncbi:MAG: hypothetical protein JWP11_3338 [Frankiales bacterium]|nr:hypothetical protein [Frankiales bacterium]